MLHKLVSPPKVKLAEQNWACSGKHLCSMQAIQTSAFASLEVDQFILLSKQLRKRLALKLGSRHQATTLWLRRQGTVEGMRTLGHGV